MMYIGLPPKNTVIEPYPCNQHKAGLRHLDDMSVVILHGYHRYLNGDEYTLDMYKDESLTHKYLPVEKT